MSGLVLLVFLAVLVLLDVPIAVALAILALAAFWATQGFDSLVTSAVTLFSASTNFPLLAIPLFILAGTIMNTAGITRRLVALASALVGFVRGGLAMVNVAASLFFAEISGSAVADVAALGSVLMPAMEKRGYPREFAAAVTSSSASLAIIIPPSIPMILYAVMADASVVQLFVAGLVPGLLGGGLMMVLCALYARKYGFPVEQAFDLCRLWRATRDAGWALVLPVIVLGGIFSGFVTATEAAGLAVAGALLVGAIYRELSLRAIIAGAADGVVQTAVVMLLIATSALLGEYLTEARLPQMLARAITEATTSPWVVLALLNLLFLVLGCFLHGAAAIVLVVPIVMPIVRAVGIDPVHFGLVVTLNIAIGQQTPPVASVLMTACSIAKADIWAVTRWNVPFIGVLLAVLLLVTYLPAIPLFLVELFYR
ncbi:MAG: TRAP transporter large permease [Geminicoccaceae bacterium]|nr:TRAP transporter large permease [Geminicoccaceae bacterium]